jgi:signal transduction histidine kinase
MSLRVRLVLLTVTLVALVAVALSALHLVTLVNTLSASALDRSELTKQQVSSFLSDHINQHAAEYPVFSTVVSPKDLWYYIVSSDRDVSSMLEKTMALSSSLIEINIAGEDGQILASSSERRVGAMLTQLRDFSQWTKGSAMSRLLDLMQRRGGPDYQVVVPLGYQGQDERILSIQVVTSTALLRDPLLEQVRGLAAVSGGALLVALVITLAATNLALRPLRRIDRTIDRIVQGNYGQGTYGGEPAEPRAAKEFAVLESKLNLLGQKFRGAREDATELRHDVDQLLERLASQLDVASRLAAISRLTGGVAHEIKNPLNAISLRLDFLRAKLGEPGAEELVKDIDVLSKEVQRLDRVVKTFLDFSRPVEVHFADVDLSELTREVADLMTPPAQLAHVALDVESPSGPVPLRGDSDLIKQAVLNLVTNAIEAMKEGGNLHLKTARENGAVTLEVSDSGPGIPPALRNKVFQLYFTTKGNGSGIGLAMTYRAVQLHNGTIEFESAEGRGTTFRLQFPAAIRHV